jgi:choloylglycine hydrolase
VSIPFGAPYKGGIYDTEYRTAMNLTNKTYFFELTTSPNVIWVDLSAMNLEAGQPVRLLDPNNIDLSGNVMGSFRAGPAPF